LFKYADGFVNYDNGNVGIRLGYPEWWLKEVG